MHEWAFAPACMAIQLELPMGFFWKTCAITHLPILADVSDTEFSGLGELSQIAVLLPDGSIFFGTYDGYGRVNGQHGCLDLMESNAFDACKMVLRSRYKPHMKYTRLGFSGRDPGQGYFHDVETLKNRFNKVALRAISNTSKPTKQQAGASQRSATFDNNANFRRNTAMARLTFKIEELKPLVAHALTSATHSPTFNMLLNPAFLKKGAKLGTKGWAEPEDLDPAKIPAHLVLVKDAGVYLLSSGLPRLMDPKDPKGQSSMAAYAKGMRPEDGWDAWQILGGDDFAEQIDLAFVKKAIDGGARHLVIDISETQISLASRR